MDHAQGRCILFSSYTFTAASTRSAAVRAASTRSAAVRPDLWETMVECQGEGLWEHFGQNFSITCEGHWTCCILRPTWLEAIRFCR